MLCRIWVVHTPSRIPGKVLASAQEDAVALLEHALVSCLYGVGIPGERPTGSLLALGWPDKSAPAYFNPLRTTSNTLSSTSPRIILIPLVLHILKIKHQVDIVLHAALVSPDLRHCAFARASLSMHDPGSVCRQQTSACAVSLMLEHIPTDVLISFVKSHPIVPNQAKPHQSQETGRSGELSFDIDLHLQVKIVRPHRVCSLAQEFNLTGF